MICSKCSFEFEGNFCPNCGAPAPQKVTCSSCGFQYEGNFCPNCGAQFIPPVSERCKHLVDKNGNSLDVEEIAAVYLSVNELKRFFRKCTNYSEKEIDELSKYIDDNIEGYDYGLLKSATIQAKLESAAKQAAPSAPPRVKRTAAEAEAYSAPPRQTKHQRIKENKRNGVACCPKCGSTSLTANKKGFGVVKSGLGALAAGALTGGVGAVVGLGAGNLGAKKVWVTCLNCGHRWKL